MRLFQHFYDSDTIENVSMKNICLGISRRRFTCEKSVSQAVAIPFAMVIALILMN